MTEVVKTPHVPNDSEAEDKIVRELADGAGFKGKNYEEIVIIAMPNTSEQNAQALISLFAKLNEHLPFSLVVTYQRLTCISKEDILGWKDKIDHICEQNGWAKKRGRFW